MSFIATLKEAHHQPPNYPAMEAQLKPLFIPLKSCYFDLFLQRVKTDELRKYGARWNENTCRVGRDVTLSKGYGKQHRVKGTVRAFKKQHGKSFGSRYRKSIADCFGTTDLWIAVISIDLETSAYLEP